MPASDDAIDREAVIKSAELHDVDRLGGPGYHDLMQNIEFAVQEVLREEGFIPDLE